MSRVWTTTRSWTLRRQLLVAVVGLLAVVSIVVGAVSAFAVRSILLGRLDSQLTAATARAEQATEHGPGGPGPRPTVDQYFDAPGQAAGTLAALISGDTVLSSGYRDATNTQRTLDSRQAALLVGRPATAVPITVDLGGALGAYRVMVSPLPGNMYLITGLPLAGVESTVTQLVGIIALVALAGLVLVAALGAAVIRATLRPLQRVARTASDVAGMQLDRGEVDLATRVSSVDANPRTEVGRVGGALNRLLDTVASALAARQASEDKVRRFVADASHELRTPLASIRGYAELNQRFETDLPPDVAHGLRRIESEATRMTSLVEDLLLLARLDSHRELERRDVDLTRLVVDAVGDAHVAAPHHFWPIEVPEEPITVPGDDQRLRQVLVNLLANARVHTPPGSTVLTELIVPPERRVVLLRVTDDGPGIEPELATTLFERFVRGDVSRSRGTGSTGLGLSIVRAIVEAHDGAVEVVSVPGRTAFTVTLPVG